MDDAKEMVLIVEDDAGLIELLNDIIQQNGCNTYCVTSANDALVWLKTATPDLILLDYSLPDLSGKEFVNLLKAEYDVIPPFIVATGWGNERTAVEMMKLGARDYIVKDSHFLEMIPLVVRKICMEIQNENSLKRTQDALIESYAFNNHIVECAQEGIVLYSVDLVVMKWNRFMEKITGSLATDIIGKNIKEAFPHNEYVGLEQIVAKAIRGEEVAELEFAFNHSVTNEIVWVADVVSTLRNIDGDIIGAISTVRDITEKKRVEEEIKKSSAEFKDLFDNAPIGYHEIDLEGRIVRMNTTELSMLGYSYDELKGKYVWEFVADRENSRQVTTAKLKGRQFSTVSFEREFVRKDGKLLSVLVMDKLIFSGNGEITGIRSSVQDISDRKNAEYEVLKISNHYKALIEKSPAGLVLLDESGQFKYLSPTVFRMFGYSPDEVSALKPEALTHPDDLAMVLENLGRFLQDPSFVPVIEYRFKHKNGDWKWIESTISNFLEDAAVESIVINFRDIHERKIAEHALHESEERYRLLAENTGDVIWKLSLDGKYQYISPAVFQLRGYTVEEAMTQSLDEMVCPNSLPFIVESFAKSLKEYYNCNLTESGLVELEQPCKDGSTVWTESSARLVFNENGEPDGYVGVSRDISERKKTEIILNTSKKRLIRAELTSKSGNWELSLDTMMMNVSDGANIIYGSYKTEFLYDEIKMFPLPIYRPSLDAAINDLILRGVEYSVEYQIETADTHEVKDIHSTAYYDKERNVVFGVIHDITERKQAEVKLIQSENKFRSITEQTNDFISIANKQGQIIYASPTSYDMFQVKPDEMIGCNFIEFVDESDISRALKVFKGHLHSAKSIEFSLKRKDGSVFVGDLNKSELMLDNEPVVLVVIRDISERILIEKALRTSEANLSEALVISNLCFWEYHAQTDMFEFNDQFYAIYNTSFEDQGGYAMSSAEYVKRFVHPDDIVAVEIEIKKLLSTTDINYRSKIVHRIVCGDGAVKYISVNITVNEVKNGVMVRAVGANLDISEMKKKEELLAKSEMFFRQSQQAGKIGSYYLNLSADRWDSSEVMNEIFGIDVNYEKSVAGWLDIVAPDDREMMSAYFTDYVLGKQMTFDKEYRIRRISDGEIRWVFGRGELLIKDGAVVAMFGTIQDINERKQAENQLNEKMNELVRFHNLTVDRELGMIELKKEVNRLLREIGRVEKYKIVE